MDSNPIKSCKHLKLIVWICVIAVLLACSVTFNTAPPTPTSAVPILPLVPTIGILSTSTQYPTYTAYPTFTLSLPTQTPYPTYTNFPVATSKPEISPTVDKNVSFIEVKRSTNSFACAGSITVTARIDNPAAVYYIDFFWRMEDANHVEKTEYKDHNMDFDGGDTYKITISGSMVPNPKHWASAWFAYQLVIDNKVEYIHSNYYSDVAFTPCP